MKEQSIYCVTLHVYSRSADELNDVDNGLCNELDYWTTEMGFVLAALGEDCTEITPDSPDYALAVERLEEKEEEWKDEEDAGE